MPNETETKPTADIWSDPNLMSIILGMVGSAAMGEHQQGWQAQLGRAATMMGQSRKAALAAEEMGKERKDWRNIIRSLIGGGEAGAELGVPETEGLGGGEAFAGAELPMTITERAVGREEQPYGGRSLYDILGQ